MTRRTISRGRIALATAGVLTLTTAAVTVTSLHGSSQSAEATRGGEHDALSERPDHRLGLVGGGGEESAQLRSQGEQYGNARTAPGIVAPGAYSAAFGSLSGLTATGTATELSTKPYDSDDLRYRDPVAANTTGGSGRVTGRITGLAVDPAHSRAYAGGADGGIFRGVLAADGSVSGWQPISDGLPTLSTGDLQYDGSTNSLWLATGEANTGGTSYVGTGVYRLPSPATAVFTPANRVGGPELESTVINKLRFDGHGRVLAATSRGVYAHASLTDSGTWTRLYAPNPSYLPGGADAGAANAPYKNMVDDVAVQPDGTGRHLVADIAWRGGDAYNGFYRSDDAGLTWTKVNPTGAINPKEIGNATFAWAADGSVLYVVLESTTLYNKPSGTVNSYLAGVYSSTQGVDGPWTSVADSHKLAGSGSALKQSLQGKGYGPGIQSWYNQFLQVDPADPQHVWLGLEEVFETKNGGSSWTTPGPYWNFSFSCWSFDPAKNTCSKTTHSDQHSIAVGGGRVYVGNDGGAYSRPVNGTLDQYGHANDWKSLNAGLDTLQYYSVGVGSTATHGSALTGGLQDNGQSLQLGDDTVAGSPFGGDGGDTLVDPRPGKGCNIVAEYVFLAMSITNNCGVSDGTTRAIRDIAPGDPGARFIAPFTADPANPDHWLAGGRYVWTQDKGYAIQSGADWAQAYDVGAGHSITATALQNGVGWVSWCGPCNNNGFTRGIATNAGGSWHQVNLASSPVANRFLAGMTIDPSDPSGRTAYAVANGFSRRWTEGPGAGQGHLYATTDGGATWADASASLPDVPSSSLVIQGGTFYLGTDLGVVTSTDRGASWHRVTGFPYVTVMQVKVGPDGAVYAATHGRGLWRVSAS